MSAPTAPTDLEPLQGEGLEGYHATTRESVGGDYLFRLIQPDGSEHTIARVNLPLTKTWTPEQHADAAMVLPQMGHSPLYPKQIRAIAEVLQLAATFAGWLNQGYLETLQEQERQHKEWERIKKAAAERHDDQTKSLYEHVRWLLDHQIRLRRDPKYRSTVFGTIKRVVGPEVTRRPFMDIVTERGKPMTILLDEVSKLDVKYDGERRFNNIYQLGVTQ